MRRRRLAHRAPHTADAGQAPHRIVLPADALVDGPTAIRPWRDSDADALVRACQDPEIARWTSVPERYGEADARRYLMHRLAAIHAGIAAPFAIVDADDLSRLLGSVALLRPSWPDRRAEVGYWLAREARGHGHACRAVALICAFGRAQLGLERVDLMADVANLASQRVATRAGFTREAVLHSYLEGKRGRQDMVVFGLVMTGARRRSGD